ncbi:major capsid protein [Ancylobacter lacus]|uniref:major capsid protein n=1 Tax=Ancylobacter lacus TaxID=2579970 RepID=UPI001BCCBB97|nr:major capsid protein [Ancylobacter lacus]MBS7541491.1 major capsid protein [Ancylobacter lacus]
MSSFPFPVDPQLTGVVIAYQNAELIADRVLPRIGPPLTRQTFRYMKFDFAQSVTVPETRVGRKGEPNEVEFGGTELDASTLDYGLDDVVPIDDVKNAPAGYNPLTYAAQGVMDLVLLDREKRVADLVFNAATYPAANKETLSGTAQWSDAASDPIGDIQDARDGMIMSPNILVLGRATWTMLRRHPKIVSSLSGSGTTSGVASLQAVTDLLELDEIVIGNAWVNTARKGQPTSLARTWGKHAALLRRDTLSTSLNQRPSFGATFQYDTRVAGQIPEPKAGLRGAIRVRAGESVKELITAADLGYFFQNAVA